MKITISRNKRLIGVCSALILTLTQIGYAQNANEKGRKIMESVDSLPATGKMISETMLDIYDSKGSLLFSKQSGTASFVQNFRNKDKKLNYSLSYFFAPQPMIKVMAP